MGKKETRGKEMSDWIPLVWKESKGLEDGDGYYLDSGLDWQDVDAWMPIPQPYRADEERNNETD